jgi:hypothetical protein
MLLNSHYDVVPVMKEHWTMPAFEGKITTVDGEQRLYGRGAQDMKPVCIQYIVAISRLVAAGVVPRRDVHLSFVPDEETGGSGTYVIIDVTVVIAATAVVDGAKNLNSHVPTHLVANPAPTCQPRANLSRFRSHGATPCSLSPTPLAYTNTTLHLLCAHFMCALNAPVGSILAALC